MEIALQLAMTTFACLGFGWLTFLVGKHGWGWVKAKLQARAADLEAKAAQRLSPALANLDARIKDAVHSEIAKLESDIASLKAKVGGLT